MLIAIAFVAAGAQSTGATGRFNAQLIAALVFSPGGNVFLMLPGNYYILGLTSFLMAAQAIGRATAMGHAAARSVTLGACVFMVSDSLIAINKFVTPVALAPLWILATYYCAQMLIVHNARTAKA